MICLLLRSKHMVSGKTQKLSEDEKSLNFPYDDNVQGVSS